MSAAVPIASDPKRERRTRALLAQTPASRFNRSGSQYDAIVARWIGCILSLPNRAAYRYFRSTYRTLTMRYLVVQTGRIHKQLASRRGVWVAFDSRGASMFVVRRGETFALHIILGRTVWFSRHSKRWLPKRDLGYDLAVIRIARESRARSPRFS